MIEWIIKACILLTVAIAAGLVSFVLMKNFFDASTAAPISIVLGIICSLVALKFMSGSKSSSSGGSGSGFYSNPSLDSRSAL